MTPAGQQALAVGNLSVYNGPWPILQDIAFAVDQGEFVGVIGPNGAGKSTLLLGLRGLRPVSSGEIRVLGRPLESLGDRQLARTIAYMQQAVNIGFGFTAREVVLAGRYPYLSWWQNEREEDHRIVAKYMAFTGVEHLADRAVQRVSGGERQRILLAKALAQETPLVFLDEPTANLDLVYQEEIFRCCQAMCAQGKTALLVAHDIRLAARFCSRLILLAGGRIVADGAPPEVVTAENLEKAYGLHAAVFINQVTGNLDIHTYTAAGQTAGKQTVHVIGGGGSAGSVIRALHERGYRLSGGVFARGDTDAEAALAFGVDYVAGPAFAPIDGDLGRQNREKIACADWTVLGSLAYGAQNLDNLKAAFAARRLIVLEDTPIEERDFTQGEAGCLYRDLVRLPQAAVMTSAEFMRRIAADAAAEGGTGACAEAGALFRRAPEHS